MIQSLPSDLLIAEKLIYEPSGLIINNFLRESEGQEYEACMFEMRGHRIKFRRGKITPTKIGQFVTLWKRIGHGPILPYDIADPIDVFIVSVRHSDHLGQFVFQKAVLYEKGIVSKEERGGKRAMRVYPPWDVTDSLQAKKTQAWQLEYFFDITPKSNSARFQKLYCPEPND